MSQRKPRLRQGLLIVFEGLDGAGKTTQIRLLAARLQQEGYDVVCLKEPTEGPWGRKLRQLAEHGRHGISPATELTWFLQDRAEDVQQNIGPALARRHIVLLDRYYFSTMAYQGALGYDPEDIRQRNEAFAPPPHLLFLLDIAAPEGLQRVQQQRQLDGFERLDYLQRVAAIFARMDFPYLRRLCAAAAPEVVHTHIWQEMQEMLRQTREIAEKESVHG